MQYMTYVHVEHRDGVGYNGLFTMIVVVGLEKKKTKGEIVRENGLTPRPPPVVTFRTPFLLHHRSHHCSRIYVPGHTTDSSG